MRKKMEEEVNLRRDKKKGKIKIKNKKRIENRKEYSISLKGYVIKKKIEGEKWVIPRNICYKTNRLKTKGYMFCSLDSHHLISSFIYQ